jgi:hypothetical protein
VGLRLARSGVSPLPRLALRLGCALKIQGEFVYPSSSGDHNSRRDSSDFARLISAIHPIAGL